MKTIITTMLIMVYFVNLSFSQQTKIDSLKNVIKTTKIDSVKLSSYLLLYNVIKFQHPDSNRQVYEEAITFANNKKHKMSIAGLYNNRAISFGVYGENDSCTSYLSNAIKLYNEIDSLLPQLSSAYNNLGAVYRNMGYYKLSIKAQLKAIKFSENINDTVKIASRMNNLAATFNDMDEFQTALIYALQVRKMHDKLPETKAKINNLIALSAIYSELNMLDSALYYNKIAEKKAVRLDYKGALSHLYNNIGEIYEKMKNLNKAEHNLLISLAFCDSIKNENYKFYPFWHLARVYRKEKKFTKAKNYINKILEFADNNDNNSYKTKAYKETYEYYKATRDFNNSLKYFELHKQWSDTMLNTEKYRQISEMNIIYETEKKEQKIAMQENESKLQKAEIKTKQRTIWGVIAATFFLLIGGVAFYLQKQKTEKQKREIVKQKHDKEMLEMQVKTHDNTKKEIASALHTGLGSDLAATILHLENKLGDSKETQNVKKIYNSIRTASHILSLPDFIISTIEEEVNNMIANFKNENLEIEARIFSKTGWKDISPIIQQNIYRIIQELFTNTMKHAQAKLIEIQLVRHADFINLNYEDNGKGYNPQEINESKGYKNEIITRTKIINGTYTDDSKTGKGTIITFKFPL